jgi:glycosyltransferase involved in cell wall biosynthesis
MINNSVKRIVNITNDSKKKYKILTFPTHERYQTQLCKTGHEFFEFNLSGQKKWNLNQCPFPKNYYSLPENNMCSYIDYDFILSQSKFWQFQTAAKINDILKLPIISLEHTVPLLGFQDPNAINSMRNMYGNINIFISEFSQKSWNIPVDSHIVKHGIDTNIFKPLDFIQKQKHVLTIANDFKNRDYCLNYTGWKNVTSGIETKLIGDNPGLSVSAPIEILVQEYNKCGVYLNTSTLSPIPTSVLEAMSCGCAVVSTATCEIPNIIQNGYNGYISNNEDELKKYIKHLLDNEEERITIGQNARKTILENYSEDNFINNWNEIFNTAYEVFHR